MSLPDVPGVPKKCPCGSWTVHAEHINKLFDGATFEMEHDAERLTSQLERVRRLMKDGEWRTIPDIAYAVGGSPQAISARLRDLRKARFGSQIVERRRKEKGLFEYRVLPPDTDPQLSLGESYEEGWRNGYHAAEEERTK